MDRLAGLVEQNNPGLAFSITRQAADSWRKLHNFLLSTTYGGLSTFFKAVSLLFVAAGSTVAVYKGQMMGMSSARMHYCHL